MDADDWNERYSTAEYVWKADPNRLLVEQVTGLEPGRALDLACGEGRNAVWLAEQGWRVTGVDFSDVGLDKGRRLAADRGVTVDWVRADATTWSPPTEGFDLVAVFYLQLPPDQRRQAIGVAGRALAPGGTLLVVAHDTANLEGGTGGPQDPAVLYAPPDVVDDLVTAGVEISVEAADTVERPVAGADRPALDCLVRLRRESSPAEGSD
ncbi:MAG TPA: class I SAM-dependent methyltransferase [Acidimicrobiales bacterium]|nr:class I SAM-dependent methyltransferase [Acidimicrobiales bacterium]